MAIVIGAEAIDRISATGVSLLVKDGPANASGIIDTVTIYVPDGGTEARKVATFFLISGTTYECRDSEDVGVLSDGLNTKTVSLAVEPGDLIGITQVPSGNMDLASEGGEGILHTGDQTDICVVGLQTAFSEAEDAIGSLYGTGAEAGWTGKVAGVTNPAKVVGVVVANIKSVIGVE